MFRYLIKEKHNYEYIKDNSRGFGHYYVLYRFIPILFDSKNPGQRAISIVESCFCVPFSRRACVPVHNKLLLPNIIRCRVIRMHSMCRTKCSALLDIREAYDLRSLFTFGELFICMDLITFFGKTKCSLITTIVFPIYIHYIYVWWIWPNNQIQHLYEHWKSYQGMDIMVQPIGMLSIVISPVFVYHIVYYITQCHWYPSIRYGLDSNHSLFQFLSKISVAITFCPSPRFHAGIP